MLLHISRLNIVLIPSLFNHLQIIPIDHHPIAVPASLSVPSHLNKLERIFHTKSINLTVTREVSITDIASLINGTNEALRKASLRVHLADKCISITISALKGPVLYCG